MKRVSYKTIALDYRKALIATSDSPMARIDARVWLRHLDNKYKKTSMLKKLLLTSFLLCSISIYAQTNTSYGTNKLVSYDTLSNLTFNMFPSNYWVINVQSVSLNVTNAYGNTNYVIHSTNNWFTVVPFGISSNLQYLAPGPGALGRTNTLCVTNGIVVTNKIGAF